MVKEICNFLIGMHIKEKENNELKYLSKRVDLEIESKTDSSGER